jgi:hypothetical protein
MRGCHPTKSYEALGEVGRMQTRVMVVRQSNSMFVPEIQEGGQGPVLALRVERKKLSYGKNKKKK